MNRRPFAAVAIPVKLLAWALCLLPALAACGGPRAPKPALAPVPALDLNRYMGTWYEVASTPNPFQKDCWATKAHYSLTDRGEVRVRNSCHKGALTGPLKEVVGKAWRPHSAQPAALKVQFFWPFRGDYWVLALDPDYGWAVVGQPKRKYVWILARTPSLPAATYSAILARLPQLGYDPGAVAPTPQPPTVPPADAP
jgi:apolipoprotein D and lipocalin family protein